mgnify:FL=1
MSESSSSDHPADLSVDLSDVHFSYDGKTDVICGVSMEIAAGQTVAFVGPSGGGKSTLARLTRGFRGYLLEKRETSFRSENEPDLFKVPRVCDFHIAFAAVDKSYLFPDSFDERRVVG